jgi:hypothetical protein
MMQRFEGELLVLLLRKIERKLPSPNFQLGRD